MQFLASLGHLDPPLVPLDPFQKDIKMKEGNTSHRKKHLFSLLLRYAIRDGQSKFKKGLMLSYVCNQNIRLRDVHPFVRWVLRERRCTVTLTGNPA